MYYNVMGGEVVFHFFGGYCCCCGYTIGLRDALHLKSASKIPKVRGGGQRLLEKTHI